MIERVSVTLLLLFQICVHLCETFNGTTFDFQSKSVRSIHLDGVKTVSRKFVRKKWYKNSEEWFVWVFVIGVHLPWMYFPHTDAFLHFKIYWGLSLGR